MSKEIVLKTTKGKISMRQAFVILTLALTSPILRVVPNYIATNNQKAIWIIPIIAIIPAILLIFVLHSFIKKYPNKNLDEIFEIILGKPIGKTLNILYILWIFMGVALYLRFYGERFLETILIGTPIEFILVIMATFLFFVVSGSIEAFARTAEMLIYLFIGIFFLAFIIIIPEIEWQNLYPVTHYDFWNLTKNTDSILAIYSYITLLLFLGGRINYKEEMRKQGIKSIIFSTIIILIVILSTVGVFGSTIIEQFPFPFFIVIKNIMLFNSIERIESLFISTWVISDFMILAMFLFIFFDLLKRLLGLNNKNNVIAPIMFLIFVFSLYLARNSFELSNFSRYIVSRGNNIIYLGVPIVIWVIGKIRKKV